MNRSSAEPTETSVRDETHEAAQRSKPRRSRLRRGLCGVLVALVFLATAAALLWAYVNYWKPVSVTAPPDYDALLARLDNELRESEPTPLDPALRRAGEGLRHIRQDIDDYTAVMIKRERVKGELLDEQQLVLKVRNRKMKGDELLTPLSAYLKFLSPDDVKGREVIWVEGHNDDRLIAHEGGLAGLVSVRLDPAGWIAMDGQRYPITQIGFENLVVKLIEKGLIDRRRDADCRVRFVEGEQVDGRPCTMIEIKHPKKVDNMEYHLARIYIDDQWNVPTKFESYDFPAEPGGEPPLLERYIYTQLKLNPGLTDEDFDPENPEYKFP